MKPDIKLLYNNLYNQADKVLKKYNPCKINGALCLRGINPCCSKCPHLDIDKGCTVKSLICKLHICTDARESTDKECLKKLLILVQKTIDNNIPLIARASREETFLKNLPSHCFILDKRYWEWGIE